VDVPFETIGVNIGTLASVHTPQRLGVGANQVCGRSTPLPRLVVSEMRLPSLLRCSAVLCILKTLIRHTGAIPSCSSVHTRGTPLLDCRSNGEPHFTSSLQTLGGQLPMRFDYHALSTHTLAKVASICGGATETPVEVQTYHCVSPCPLCKATSTAGIALTIGGQTVTIIDNVLTVDGTRITATSMTLPSGFVVKVPPFPPIKQPCIATTIIHNAFFPR